MVALATGQAEETFLEDRVPRVPQCEREAQPPVIVRDAEQPVLAPAVHARASMVVWERIPGRAGGGVVLAHGIPLTFREIRAPAPPWHGALALIDQSLAFGWRLGHGWSSLRIMPSAVEGRRGDVRNLRWPLAGSLVLGRPVSAWPARRRRNAPSCADTTDTSYQLLVALRPTVAVSRAFGRSTNVRTGCLWYASVTV